MAQFDVYENTNTLTQEQIPYLLDIQNDLLDGLRTRVVVPLGIGVMPISHLNPVLEIDGFQCVMLTQEMAGVPVRLLSKKVMNLSHRRTDILHAVDFLVTGF